MDLLEYLKEAVTLKGKKPVLACELEPKITEHYPELAGPERGLYCRLLTLPERNILESFSGEKAGLGDEKVIAAIMFLSACTVDGRSIFEWVDKADLNMRVAVALEKGKGGDGFDGRLFLLFWTASMTLNGYLKKQPIVALPEHTEAALAKKLSTTPSLTSDSSSPSSSPAPSQNLTPASVQPNTDSDGLPID